MSDKQALKIADEALKQWCKCNRPVRMPASKVPIGEFDGYMVPPDVAMSLANAACAVRAAVESKCR